MDDRDRIVVVVRGGVVQDVDIPAGCRRVVAIRALHCRTDADSHSVLPGGQ